MKKILTLLLTFLLVINCLGLKTIYAENDGFGLDIQNNEISLGATEGIPTDVLDTLARLDPNGNLGFINAIQSVSKIATTVSGIFNAYNGVMGFLRSLGIIKDPQKQFQREVISKLNEINNTTKQMNEKLDDVTNNLERYFSESSQQFSKQQVMLNRQNIQAFKTDYEEKMENRMSSFGHTVDSKFKLWFESSNRSIETNAGFYSLDGRIKYNESDVVDKTNDTKSINISAEEFASIVSKKKYTWVSSSYSSDLENLYAEYCKQAVEYVKAYDINDEESITNARVYTSGLLDWMAEYVYKNTTYDFGYKTDYEYANTPYQKIKLLNQHFCSKDTYIANENPNLIANMASCFGQQCVQQIGADIYKEICDENEGSSYQYVNDVCNEFRNYCNKLSSGVNSPMNNQLDIIFQTKCFQGEAIDSINSTKDYYVGTLSKYASFYLGIMKQCDISDYEDYVTLYINTAKELMAYYNNSVVLDDRGNLVNNYCYITNSPLSIETATLTQTMKIKHVEWENNLGMEYDCYTGYENITWALSYGNNVMADNDDLLKVAALYKQLNKGESFMQYIEKNINAPVDSHKNIPYFITKFQGTKEFNLSENRKLKVKKVGRSTYFDYDTFKVNEGGEDDLENEYFFIHDAAVASTFNVNTLKNDNNTTLESRALYGEHHGGWRRDESAFFYDSPTKWNNLRCDFSWPWTVDNDHYYYTDICTSSSTYYFISEGPVGQDISISLDIGGGIGGLVPNGVEDVINDTPMSYYAELDDYVPYVLYADEEKYFNGDIEHDTKVYQGFYNYCCDESVIDEMGKDYYKKIDALFKNKDLNNGKIDANLSSSQMDNLVDEVINYYAKDGKDVLIDKGDFYEIKDEPIIFEDEIREGKSFIIPKKSAKNLRAVIIVAYMPVFKLDCKDPEGPYNINNYSYELINDYFNVKPFLFWEENGEEKYIPIENKVLKKLNLNFTVKMPISKEIDGTNKAIVNHHASNQDNSEIYETLTGTLYGNKGERYVAFNTRSFSPFSVEKCYKEESPLPTPSHNYLIPNTGIK